MKQHKSVKNAIHHSQENKFSLRYVTQYQARVSLKYELPVGRHSVDVKTLWLVAVFANSNYLLLNVFQCRFCLLELVLECLDHLVYFWVLSSNKYLLGRHLRPQVLDGLRKQIKKLFYDRIMDNIFANKTDWLTSILLGPPIPPLIDKLYFSIKSITTQ